jgi:hypothetical protein
MNDEILEVLGNSKATESKCKALVGRIWKAKIKGWIKNDPRLLGITLAGDVAGAMKSNDVYDLFGAIAEEVRKRCPEIHTIHSIQIHIRPPL